jgi:hypothetical protein
MTTLPHERPTPVKRSAWLDTRDVWASLAITAIWLAVLFTSVFGGSFVGHSNDGSSATIPSGIIVAFFAVFATRAVAKYGFTKRDE